LTVTLIATEKKLIAAIRQMARQSRNRAVIRGIGDDCAIMRLSPRHELLVTTDFSIENIHFRRQWHPGDSVGHRCLARGLSDIAAMGGTALACFLSLALPPKLPQRWADDFLRGLCRLAKRYGVQLAGGDTSAAHEITADIVVVGEVPAGEAILRSGARPGDQIYVTGELGGSTATLKHLFSGRKVRPLRGDRHFYPEPRLEIGAWLRRQGLASAMIDHICEESGVSAKIVGAKIPLAAGTGLDLAIHGGEDYELLFTAPPKAKIPAVIGDVSITHIGSMSQKDYRSAITILDNNGRARPVAPLGWQHFRR
jgi:thiamine-monophosphate kinase